MATRDEPPPTPSNPKCQQAFERTRQAGDPPERQRSDALNRPDDQETRQFQVGEMILNVAKRKALGRKRLIVGGPATDADAEIDQAISRTGKAPVVDISERLEARPSKALLESQACRTALAKAR